MHGKKHVPYSAASLRPQRNSFPGTAFLALVATISCHIGCYAPPGSYEPYPPYGQPCVPPPATGAVGTAPGYYPGTYYPGYSPYGPQYGSPYTNPYAPPYAPQQNLQPVAPLGSAPTNQPQASNFQNEGNWQTARGTNPNLGYIPPYDNNSSFASYGAGQNGAGQYGAGQYGTGGGTSRDREISAGARGSSLIWTNPADNRVAQATWNGNAWNNANQPPTISTVPYYPGYGVDEQVGLGVAAAPGPFVYSSPSGSPYSSPVRPSIVRRVLE